MHLIQGYLHRYKDKYDLLVVICLNTSCLVRLCLDNILKYIALELENGSGLVYAVIGRRLLKARSSRERSFAYSSCLKSAISET